MVASGEHRGKALGCFTARRVGELYANASSSHFDPTRTSADGHTHCAGLPPIGGYNVVAITTPIQNNSGRPKKLVRRPVAG